jgi:hypothetical protein
MNMKRILFRHRLWLLALGSTSLAMVACALGQRPPTERLCTLIGCGPSLEIVLVGEHVPTDFTVTITSPSDGPLTVRCTEGTAHVDPPEAMRWSPACPAGGVSFQDFTPSQLGVSAHWSDGDVTQDFEPVYSESRPNGPACEPACRSARLELRIPRIPPYGDVSTWAVYTDEEHGFSLRHPSALPLEFGPQVAGHRIVFIGDKMQARTSSADPLVCQGECPMIESAEAVIIAGRQARLVRGYIGSMDGNVPQHFMLYLIRSGTTHISLVLYAGSRYATAADPTVILPLHEEDIALFDRIVQTLEFGP